MTKQRKEYIVLGILVLAIAYVVYNNFFKKPSVPEDLTAVPGANNSAPEKPFLPFGTKLELDTIRQAQFKGLIPPTYPTVQRSEVGVINPFGE